ncbi:MAG: glycosyltransferase family 1 protein [Candidatus Zambryskibacteria bacterium]|nr:glycosyltransferase family 1 protein [Candidatus Zambryskibacteria bacterium]
MKENPQKRLKILFFITKSNWGGAQRHVFDIATNLSTKEFDTTVIVGGKGILKNRLEECKIKTISLEDLQRDIHALNDTKSFLQFYKFLKQENPDILHLHSPKAAGLGALSGRMYNLTHRHKVRIIYTVHGWTFNENRNILSKLIIIIASWITSLLSHKVIVLGEREKDQTEKWPWVKGKFKIIKIGIAKPSFLARTKARDFISEKIGKKIDKSTIIIGTIAELHKNKGHIYILNALAQIKNIIPKFLFVIMSDGEERANLERIIKEKKLTDNVVLLGHVHNASLYLKAFDIFTLTSIKEGLPYTLLEAGKAELPIIASNVGNIAELIDDMHSGILIKSKNIREIAESIQFLINHPEKRKEFAHSAYEKINEDYSLSKMLKETIKLYV